MERIYFIGMVLFFCTTILYVSKHRNLKADLKISKETQQKDFIDYCKQQDKLRSYTLISFELNNICEKFKSSREEKAKNETLQKLLKEIN